MSAPEFPRAYLPAGSAHRHPAVTLSRPGKRPLRMDGVFIARRRHGDTIVMESVRHGVVFDISAAQLATNFQPRSLR